MLKIFPWGKVKNSLGESQDLLEKTQSIYSVAKNSLMGKTLVIVVKGKKKTNSGWAVNLAQPVMAGESGEEEKKKEQ